MGKQILLGAKENSLCQGERIEKIFEKMAETKPREIAVKEKKKSYSYEELNNMVNALSIKLFDLGVERNDVVAIRFERSTSMLVMILAILKVGATFVPIGIRIPAERVEYILKDSGAKMFLVQEREMLVETSISVYVYNELDLDFCAEYIGGMFSTNDVAYILYTSGSTGLPKGVKVQHSSVINHIMWRINCIEANAEDVFLLKTPYTFDISIWEMFLWFFVGAQLCILPDGDERNAENIISAIYDWKVTVCQFVPSLLSELLKYAAHRKTQKKLSSLRVVFSGGEVLSPTLVERFKTELSEKYNTILYNVYGPTETTIDSTFYRCDNTECEKWDRIPLGQPIWNTNIYIIDDKGNICEEGTEGEIVISGEGVALGYVGNSPSAAFFHLDHITDENVYRTGDLGEILDGKLFFCGRRDQQIKIRGMRVELEEIESRLLMFEKIEKAVVGYDELRGGRFYALYVSNESIETTTIKIYLEKYLPEYMVPNYFIRVPEINYISSGKIDRSKMNAIFNDMISEKAKEKIQEIELSPIETEVMNVLKKSVGFEGDIKDSATLVDLGINSIEFISLIVALEDSFEIVIDGEMLVPSQYPTVFDMIKYVALLAEERN